MRGIFTPWDDSEFVSSSYKLVNETWFNSVSKRKLGRDELGRFTFPVHRKEPWYPEKFW